MLKVASDDKNFLYLAQGLANNRKFKFDVQVGKWSILVKGNADKAVEIFDLCVPTFSPLILKRSGDTVLIYDSDVYLNRRFINIFINIPKDATHAGLTPRLAVANR